MYILNLSFNQDKTPSPELIELHTNWVKTAFAQQHFLVAGPKQEEKGGVIVAQDMTKNQLDSLIACDPFIESGIASYTVTPFDMAFSQESIEMA